MREIKKIGVIGMGYVGIPSAILFANAKGIEKVYGFQRESKSSGYKIKMLNSGESPLKGKEPQLEYLLNVALHRETFECTSNYDLISEMDAITLTIQTPFSNKESLIPDYEPLKNGLIEVGNRLQNDMLVVLESTITPGTTESLAKSILEKQSGLIAGVDFALAHAPERVMVGKLIDNIQTHDRIVGGINNYSTEYATNLYSKVLVKGKVIPMTAKAAETTKTAENTIRDLQIAASNQLALYCESMGINFYDVKLGIDSLKGKGVERAMLNPGAGVGGHCLTKDAYHLERGVALSKSLDYPKCESLFTTARCINDFMPTHMYNLMISGMGRIIHQIRYPVKIAILGWSFLENSDDIRESPSISFAMLLDKMHINYVIHDPYIGSYNTDFCKIIKDSDALVIFTAHDQYKKLLSDPTSLKKDIGREYPVIIDGRNIISADAFIDAGFIYKGIGRGDKNNHEIVK
jgi:UDP-N-acetyl-D-mannosaminuronic acid dehydrogenase